MSNTTNTTIDADLDKDIKDLAKKLFQDGEALASLALRCGMNVRLAALLRHRFGILRRHAVVRENKYFSVQIQQFSRFLQAPSLKDDIITRIPKFHANDHIVSPP